MLRSMVLGAASVAAAFIGVASAELNPKNAQDTLTIMRKLQCSTIDNEPAVYWWHGVAYGRRQGEKDKKLFLVEGMNIRACSAVTDDKAGDGFHLVSREILLYKDAETGKVLKTWDNPWTGEEVEVLHVANDPVNFKMFEKGRDGKPAKWGGEVGTDGTWWYRSTFPLWYPNPLASQYEKEIGGTFHATVLFFFFGRTADPFAADTTTANVTV
ncbi:MAG: DUF1838 family protein, partial [Parvularculaceae bacterium]|nr:DUF1838 family protein [Parvularculaceae bacterium]